MIKAWGCRMISDDQVGMMFALAKKQQEDVSQLIRDLEKASQSIKSSAKNEIESQTKESIESMSKDAQNVLNNSVEPFKIQMNELITHTNTMNKNMVDVANYLNTKVIAFVSVVCFSCVIGSAAISYWFASDVKRLRAEHVQLQANIKALEEAGGKVYLHHCGERLCVRVEPSQNPYKDPNTGLPMYFVK